MEALLHPRQQEVHRAQAEDRKDVGGQHDEWVGGDRKDRWDRVHREDQVDDADHRHHYQQRCGHLHAVVHGKKELAVVVRADLEAGVNEAQRRVVRQIGLLPGRPPHLDAGEHQEGAEHVQDPVELRDQPGADQDQDCAQHDRTQYADHQHTLLVFRQHREEGEHHQEDEDVVHRQCLFDEVTGDELHRLGVGLFVAVEAAEVPPQPADKQERHQHPDQRPDAGLFHADAVRALLAQREEIDRQRRDHEHGENSPQQRGADRHHFFERSWLAD